MLEDLSKSHIKEFTDEDLAAYCVSAYDYTKDTIVLKRELWDKAWATYNNQFDFSEKADWQHRNYLPKFKMSVRNAKMILKNSLIKAGTDYFQVKGTNDATKALQFDIQDTISKVLDQSEFRQVQVPKGIFRGLLENLIIFKTWVEDIGDDPKIHPRQEFKFPIMPVSAYHLFIDPTGRDRYVIHWMKKDLSHFKKLVDAGVYEQTAMEGILADFQAEEEEMEEKIRSQQIDQPKPEWRKEVEIMEFWGDVDDKDGNTLYENVTYTVVNRKYIARKPKKNPFDHKRPPFIYGAIVSRDGDPYHEGFGDSAVPIARLINEHLNETMDSNLASSIKAFEIDVTMIHNPSSLKSGIYPGKTIQTKSNGMPGSRAVNAFEVGRPSEYSLPIMQYLSTEYDNSAGINEFIAGVMGSGAGSATEAKIKTSSGMSILQAMAQEIEDNVFRPLITMIYKNILQYNPEIFGDKFNSVSIEDLKFNVVVDGMSKVLQNMDDLNKLFMVIGMVGKTPAGQMLNWNEIMRRAFVMINQDPEKLITAQPPAPPAGMAPQGIPAASPQQVPPEQENGL